MKDLRRLPIHFRLLRVAVFALTNVVLITWLYKLLNR